MADPQYFNVPKILVREPRLLVPNRAPVGRCVLTDEAKALGIVYAWTAGGVGRELVVSDDSTPGIFKGNPSRTFNGSSQEIDLGTPSRLAITGQIFLFARHTYSYPPGLNVLVAKGYDGTKEGYFLRYGSGYFLESGTFVASVTHAARWEIPSSTFGIDDIVNAAGLFDGSTWRVYAQGIERATGGTVGASSTSTRVSIGAEQIGATWPDRYWSGRIELVYIGNRGITALPAMLERDPYQFLIPV